MFGRDRSTRATGRGGGSLTGCPQVSRSPRPANWSAHGQPAGPWSARRPTLQSVNGARTQGGDPPSTPERRNSPALTMSSWLPLEDLVVGNGNVALAAAFPATTTPGLRFRSGRGGSIDRGHRTPAARTRWRSVDGGKMGAGCASPGAHSPSPWCPPSPPNRPATARPVVATFPIPPGHHPIPLDQRPQTCRRPACQSGRLARTSPAGAWTPCADSSAVVDARAWSSRLQRARLATRQALSPTRSRVPGSTP